MSVRHECDSREFQVIRDKEDDEWTMADDLGDSTALGQRVDVPKGNIVVPGVDRRPNK